jgi:hypothetical protein
MPDSPVHAKFLTKEERIAALERVRDDQGGTENKKIKKDQIFEAFMDPRTWLIVLTTLMSMFSWIEMLAAPHYFCSPSASIPNGALSNCEPFSCAKGD